MSLLSTLLVYVQFLLVPDNRTVLNIKPSICWTEQEILQQYEASLRFDEEALCATVEGLEMEDDVLCPVCTK